MSVTEVLVELDRLIAGSVVEDRPALVVALANRLARLGTGLAAPTSNGGADPGHEEGQRLLTPSEAAAVASVEVRWLNRATKGQRFRKQFSRRLVRYEVNGLRRWLATRIGR